MTDPNNFSFGQQPRPDHRIATLRAQLAAVAAQRDELLRVAVALADVCDRMDKLSDIEFDRLEHEFHERVGEVTGTAQRIARAQPEQPPNLPLPITAIDTFGNVVRLVEKPEEP